MKTKKEQQIELAAKYTEKLYAHVMEMLTDEECDYYIDPEEMDATVFIYALANGMPSILYSKLTGMDLTDHLEFNYLANRLCFQFSNKVD